MRLLIFMKSSNPKNVGRPPSRAPHTTTPLPITTIMSDGGAAAGGPPPSGQQSMTSFLPPHDGAAAVAAPLAPHGANTQAAKLTFPGKVLYARTTNTRNFCEFCNTSIPIPETSGRSVRLPYPYPESTNPAEQNWKDLMASNIV